MPESSLRVPVLFLIFNRPDTTQEVFNEIRRARPAQLFVAADGPRKDRPEDPDLCKKAREIVRQVDWECSVQTLLREENLGCKRAISSAIDWFFSHVDEGIILEDDCVPDQSFFPFCENLLERYRDDERVMMIAGTNYLFNKAPIRESYYFSRFYAIWGWATWRRAWALYDIRMTGWPEFNKKNGLREVYRHKQIVPFFRKMMQEAYENRLDTWDIQWAYSCIIHHGLSIVPGDNLIRNIGNTGLHTVDPGPFHAMPTKRTDTSRMVHPKAVSPRYDLDTLTFHAIAKDERFPRNIYSCICSFKKRYLDRK